MTTRNGHTIYDCPQLVAIQGLNGRTEYLHGDCQPVAPNALEDMLSAARALHDRDPNRPAYCATCLNSNTGDQTEWPCPTATALGATGRSEWTTPPATCKALPTQNPDNWRGPCQCPAGHTGLHYDENGAGW